jgi:predicted nucleotidyltransferase
MGKTERSAPNDITPLLEPLIALQNLIENYGYQGVIIGGIAASLLGKPRFTADLDAVILASIEDIPALIDASNEQGIVSRVVDAEAFARKYRVLLLRHRASGTNIDISFGILPFENEMIARSQNIQIGSFYLRLPTPEDLIILKAVAHRTQDLADIEAVAASHPDLDKEWIQSWVEQFGEALELPELWEMIAPLL